MDEERAKKRKEYEAKIQEFRLMDDTFATSFFDGDIENVELMIRVILNRTDIKVTDVRTQYEIKNLHGRGVRLDVKAVDRDDRMIDIEIQNESEGADPKRARYNSSLMDANSLVRGEEFSDLPENYVIFITRNDYFGEKQPLYKVERTLIHSGRSFGDGSHIVYVNGADRDESTELGKLVHDLFCQQAKDMYYKSLADKVRYYKETEEGVSVMCKIMEDIVTKEREDAAKVAAKEAGIRVTVENGIEDGLGKDRILQRLVKKFFLSPTEAEQEFDKYSAVMVI